MSDLHFWYTSSVIVLTLFACAKQGFPPGGPEDRTPPEVISVHPASGATGVDVHTIVSIGFSEWIEAKSLKESVFISPTPQLEPRIQVKGKRVHIDVAEGLNLNQTYVITLGTGVKDLHGNGLKSSWTLAFSTGDRVDTGRISGRIFSEEEDVNGSYALAYIIRPDSVPDPMVDAPDYVVQADEFGSYSFSHLSPGLFRLFAFLDKNRDARYSVGVDPLGVPTEDVLLRLDGLDVENRDFVLALRDTTGPKCMSVVALDRIHVDVRFSEPVNPVSLESVGIAFSGNGSEIPLWIRARHVDRTENALCHLLTEPQKEGATYRVDACTVVDNAGNPVTIATCVCSLSGSGAADTVRPVIVATSPMDSARNVPLDQRIEFGFSEALDTANISTALHLMTGGAENVSGSIEWSDAATFVFIPGEGLKGQSAYTAALDPSYIRDMAGNILNGGGTEIFFTTISPDTLGHISGTLTDEDSFATGRLFVRARKVGTDLPPVETVLPEPGPFFLSSLTPGWYRLWAFRDEDGDGQFSFGSPNPIRFAERCAWYPDTVEVRARWETQAVDMILRKP